MVSRKGNKSMLRIPDSNGKKQHVIDRIYSLLKNSQTPLTTSEIAKNQNVSTNYVRTVLRRIEKRAESDGYVLRVNKKGRFNTYYLVPHEPGKSATKEGEGYPNLLRMDDLPPEVVSLCDLLFEYNCFHNLQVHLPDLDSSYVDEEDLGSGRYFRIEKRMLYVGCSTFPFRDEEYPFIFGYIESYLRFKIGYSGSAYITRIENNRDIDGFELSGLTNISLRLFGKGILRLYNKRINGRQVLRSELTRSYRSGLIPLNVGIFLLSNQRSFINSQSLMKEIVYDAKKLHSSLSYNSGLLRDALKKMESALGTNQAQMMDVYSGLDQVSREVGLLKDTVNDGLYDIDVGLSQNLSRLDGIVSSVQSISAQQNQIFEGISDVDQKLNLVGVSIGNQGNMLQKIAEGERILGDLVVDGVSDLKNTLNETQMDMSQMMEWFGKFELQQEAQQSSGSDHDCDPKAYAKNCPCSPTFCGGYFVAHQDGSDSEKSTGCVCHSPGSKNLCATNCDCNCGSFVPKNEVSYAWEPSGSAFNDYLIKVVSRYSDAGLKNILLKMDALASSNLSKTQLAQKFGAMRNSQKYELINELLKINLIKLKSVGKKYVIVKSPYFQKVFDMINQMIMDE